MGLDIEGKRDDALSFLVNHSTGVLATVSESGKARARMIYYTCDDSFNVYFITLKNTRKVSDISSNKSAAFVVSESDIPRTLQIEGTITDLTETATNDPLMTDFMQQLMSHTQFGIPLARFDSSSLTFFRLAPSWVRWGDFTAGKGTDAVLTEVQSG